MTTYPKYKPTAIDWIGEIPRHSELNKIKYCSSVNDDALPENAEEDFEMSCVDISSVQKEK